MGRIRAKMEQTRTHVPPPTRLRINDITPELLQKLGCIRDLFGQCASA